MSENACRLLLDAGNSYLKWACEADGVLSCHGQHQYDHSKDDFGIADSLSEISAKISSVAAASVAGQHIEQVLRKAVRELFGCDLHMQHVDTSYPQIEIAYKNPERLGIDRWLAMAGAFALHDGAVCVADCGTALTLDCVSENGRHLGGIIVPGYRLMHASLLTETARIDATEQPLPRTIFAQSTDDAVNSGISYAMAAIVDRFVEEAQNQLGALPLLMITGGDRERLLKTSRHDAIEVPDLVLLGLAMTLDYQSQDGAG